MTEVLKSDHTKLERLTPVKESKLKLVFHVPRNVETKSSDQSIEMLVEVRAVSTEETLIVDTPTNAIAPVKSIIQEKVHQTEFVSDVIPFFSFKLSNSPAVNQVGNSYIKDLEKGYKHFAFSSLIKDEEDMSILVYGSFVNYKSRKPVLIVVNDLKHEMFNQYRSNFSKGTLWKWQTHDWGNVCLIDYKQLEKCADDFQKADIDFITHEFQAVFWALPSDNKEAPVEIQKVLLPILNKINSVTFITKNGETKTKILKKSADYYNCFNIPVKGILTVGDDK